jgi:hypothetical protein
MLHTLQPVPDLCEAFRLEMVQPVTAMPFFPDKAGLAKDAQVFGRCRPAQVEQPGELARRPRPVAELIEDDAACRVGDSAEDIRKHRTSIRRKIPTHMPAAPP